MSTGSTLTGVTPRRTILDADVHDYACLVGDFSPIHVDDVYAKESAFGARLLHGPGVFAITGGLMAQSGLFDGHLAFLESSFRMEAPVYIGDTLHAEVHETSSRVTSDGEREVVEYAVRTINQRGITVLTGRWVQMRPLEEPTERTVDSPSASP